jgi:membrane fusion protein (multidrug efflux system)
MKNQLMLAACVAIGLAAAGCKPEGTATGTKAESPAAVKVVRPKKGDILRTVTLPAMIAANQQAMLYAKASGYLKRIGVDKGDEVKEGDLLAEIEAPELIADVARAKAELQLAQIEYKRAEDAQKRAPDLVVIQTVDTAKGRFEVAKANLERAEVMVSFCKITAPFAGVVTRRFVDPGAFIPAATAGSNARSAALLSLADFKTVRVQMPVPESEVPLVVKGLPVNVSVEGLAGRNILGTVTRFAHVLDEMDKTMLTEIDLENTRGELRPGMYATAKLGVEKHSDALLLPVDAVLMEKSGAAVFTVADGKAKKTPVRTGFNDGAFIEILEGVQPNDSVILVGKMILNNGQPVNAVESK